MNEHSSRSHAIFIITIECSEVTVTAYYQIQSSLTCITLQQQSNPGCDHLSQSLPKYQKFPSQNTIFGTSCKRSPFVSGRDHFSSEKFGKKIENGTFRNDDVTIIM